MGLNSWYKRDWCTCIITCTWKWQVTTRNDGITTRNHTVATRNQSMTSRNLEIATRDHAVATRNQNVTTRDHGCDSQPQRDKPRPPGCDSRPAGCEWAVHFGYWAIMCLGLSVDWVMCYCWLLNCLGRPNNPMTVYLYVCYVPVCVLRECLYTEPDLYR